MSTKASFAQVLKDEDILKDLANKAKELDLPLTADSFVLKRDDGPPQNGDQHPKRLGCGADLPLGSIYPEFPF